MIRALGEGEAYGASRGLAIFYILRGDIEAAADCYARAIEERDPNIPNALQGRLAESIRASARWPRLAAMMNLPAGEKIGL
jgi:tetratricopeptide (TPR) repeat protein